MTYALYHLTVNGRTVEMSHGTDLYSQDIAHCDQWLWAHRQREQYRQRRDRLAELKETHGSGYRPGLEAVR